VVEYNHDRDDNEAVKMSPRPVSLRIPEDVRSAIQDSVRRSLANDDFAGIARALRADGERHDAGLPADTIDFLAPSDAG